MAEKSVQLALLPNVEDEVFEIELFFPICDDWYYHSCVEFVSNVRQHIHTRKKCPGCGRNLHGWLECKKWFELSEQCEGMQSDAGESNMNRLIAEHMIEVVHDE
jgi:hypothetical protein